MYVCMLCICNIIPKVYLYVCMYICMYVCMYDFYMNLFSYVNTIFNVCMYCMYVF